MQAVQGYMTKDGAFYNRAEDARLHEAVQSIRELCESHTPKGIDPVKFMHLLSQWSSNVREFIDAQDAAKYPTQENSSPSGRDKTDDELRDAEHETLEQLKVGGHNDMPDVGDSTRTESVSERRQKHGARVR